MKICWLTLDSIGTRNGAPFSASASIRYRALIPGGALAARGHHVDFIEIYPGSPPRAPAQLRSADVVVVSKIFADADGGYERPARALWAALEHAGQAGRPILFDISDDNFHKAGYRAFYERASAIAAGFVCSTEALRERIASMWPIPVSVVCDPVEGERRDPAPPLPFRYPRLLAWLNRLPLGEPVWRARLLWFGHSTNYPSLRDACGQLRDAAASFPLHLHVVSAAGSGFEALCSKLALETRGRLTAAFSPWSPETMEKALAACDLVVIPSTPDSARAAVKSANRLTESLWAGRFVVAHPVPSYLEFREYAWLGERLDEGLRWALRSSGDALARVRTGQAYIGERFSRDAVAQKWLECFQRYIDTREVGSVQVKLNLGCGDKILPGYVNVDVAASRAGREPDVLCDLRRLNPFQDNSTDEVLSVHVVEHFGRWEIVDVLREWVRVLRPGGRMVLECPNLRVACEQFLADPNGSSGPGPEGQRTMWVFYGDPAWKDPLMIHRWGYTPESLAVVMSEAGLVDVRQEPAQFKLREPRDMRVVGTKPAA